MRWTRRSVRQWVVEIYGEEVEGRWAGVFEDEVLQLLKTEAALDVGQLVEWVSGLSEGRGDPDLEPDMEQGGYTLKYRPVGDAVLIFCLVDGSTVLILRMGRSASALPTVSDLIKAAERRAKWRRK